MTEFASLAVRGKAMRAVRSAIEQGVLIKPNHCQKCGLADGPNGKHGASRIHGHHYKGYDHPLDVEWLCVYCHRAETPTPKGIRAYGAKLNEDLVREIRRRYFAGEGSNSLAREYGVTRQTIRCTAIGINWRHI